MNAAQLGPILESFLVARWGKQVKERLRAPPGARPWKEGVEPEQYRGMTWVIFADHDQPLGVGIREEGKRNGVMIYLCAYWRRADKLESHLWRCHSAWGWQHVAER